MATLGALLKTPLFIRNISVQLDAKISESQQRDCLHQTAM
jgi:hypothetical protein